MALLRNKKSVQERHDRDTLKIFWQAAMVYKPLLWWGLLFPAGILFSSVVAPLFISKTIGALALPGGRPEYYLVLFVIAAALGLLFNRIGHPAFIRHQVMVSRDLQLMALSTLMRRGVGFHNNTVGGKLVSDAIDYLNAYSQVADSIATGLVPLAVTLVAGALIIFPESWLLGLFVTIMATVIIGLGVRDSRRMAPRRQIRIKAVKVATAHIADAITNIQTVKTFGREDQEQRIQQHLSQRLAEIRTSDWLLMSTRGNDRLIILALLQVVLIWVIIQTVRQDPALLGTSIFAFVFSITLSNRLFEVNMLIRTIEEGLMKASPLTEIIQEAPEISDRPGARSLKVDGGRIDFAAVGFRYQDGQAEEPLFSGLTLTIAPGEKIGLIGPSGGGKSTLTRLLLRFEDINDGTITIDGQNIAEVTQRSLRRSIAYVPQEPLLFHRSIRDNIAYGKPSASLQAVEKAAQQAHADGFIAGLGDGYDTVVGERGVKLSGGQRQRIAIARAILKDAPILILDEATSALDSESEVLIQDALWKLMEGRTALVVAHRLSTIQKMDRIIVLDEGSIVEQGTHDQLLTNKGLYAKLWSHQSGGFLKD